MDRSSRAQALGLRLFLAGSVVALAVVAGCGGGGSSSPGVTAVSATPTPNPYSPIQLFLVAQDSSGSPITEPTPGQFGVNQLSVPFTALGAVQAVLVYEPGFTGTFSANAQNCTPNPGAPAVTVSPASAPAKSAIFTITSTAAGFCDVKIIDGTNGAAILVDVTTTTGTISGIRRR